MKFQRAPWASYQIRKITGCACAGNAGNVFPRHRLQRKPLVSDPGMYHGTCVTHVPWCMSGSLTPGGGENVPGIPGACASAILRNWQEAHWKPLYRVYIPNFPNFYRSGAWRIVLIFHTANLSGVEISFSATVFSLDISRISASGHFTNHTHCSRFVMVWYRWI